jgi:hypothetical protein
MSPASPSLLPSTSRNLWLRLPERYSGPYPLQCGAAHDATIALLKPWYSHEIARVQPSAWDVAWRQEWDAFRACNALERRPKVRPTESTAIPPTLSILHLHASLSIDDPAMSIQLLSEFPNTHRCSLPPQPSCHWVVVWTFQRPSTPRIAAQ